MKVTFLGTAAAEGFPGLWCNCSTCSRARRLGGKNLRSRSSVLVDDDLLVDFGPDASCQATRLGVDLTRVRDILVTHGHADHLSFYDVQYRFKGYHQQGKLEITTLWGNETVKEKFLHQARAAIAEQFPGIEPPTIEEVEEDLEGLLAIRLAVLGAFQEVAIGDYRVFTLKANHNPRENCMNYIIDDGRARFLYGIDTGPWSDETWKFLEGLGFKLDIVALDCTVGTGKPGGHHSTASFLETRESMQERGLLENDAIFIAHHFSHQWSMVHDDMVEFMEPRGVIVSHDGLVVER